MAGAVTVRVPDIGDFEDVEVIEILVTSGDRVAEEDPLITLESDKATLDIPSPHAGRVAEVLVSVGDRVSEGAEILRLEVDEAVAEETDPRSAEDVETAAADRERSGDAPRGGDHAEVLVLGAGPGGYSAAFRAADLGRQVVLVERYPDLGGVCLNVGCIPSKALLHVAEVVTAAQELADDGVGFDAPRFELEKLRARQQRIVGRLTGGLAQLAKQRGVEVVTGRGHFVGPHAVQVETSEGTRRISFEHAIVAVGSQPTRLPGIPHDHPRVMDSTGALALEDVPERLLVVGGGIIGLEMAAVYDALGSRITVVELLDTLLPGVDRDLVRPLRKRIEERYEGIHLETRVAEVEAGESSVRVRFEGKDVPEQAEFERVLVAVGRTSNGDRIAAEQAGVEVDDRGYLRVDAKQRTNVPHIYAVGDVTGPPMLAHRAVHQGKVAAEVISGLPAAFDARAVPSVAYTDPEVAWMGLTEQEAREGGVSFEKATFPWSASGRALSMGREDGLTKLLVDPESRRILGAGSVGTRAGELIAETVLALEMGADVEDLSLTIHPHPTLSETVAFAAEMAHGSITDLLPPKRRRQDRSDDRAGGKSEAGTKDD